jgi:cell division protein FtsI/penicillin-binding protein 2
VLALGAASAAFGAAATRRGTDKRTQVKPAPAKRVKGVAMSIPPAKSSAVAEPAAPKAAAAKKSKGVLRGILRGPWRVPTYMANITEGDQIDGEDLVVRRAAVAALAGMNGTVVVADPETGRVLTMVNQKLALKDGFQPCSTVKIPVALAALSESVVERTTPIRLYGKTSIQMTEALAKSNNQYFAALGEKLGFERVSYYARLFGLGEKAGLNIEGESAGILPSRPPRNGIGMMTSFGDGISLTPLELTALMGAVANGGTLYYLQYPKSAEEADALIPRVKRRLAIEQLIPEIKPGMNGAVEYGTARRVGYEHPNEDIFGKTGTCTDMRSPTHLGWFGSFMDTPRGKLAVTVLLTGAQGVSGPTASGVAANVYRNLEDSDFFTRSRETSPVALIENPSSITVRTPR